ncbi:hypothetical protein [Opitutus sp. GAS368]|uniref:hypothetical protein n=1 Tax=Opitutus sp. GAS368 TaxID=1882749 RepID=UPI00087ADDB2|nr:hypothetical protein [Opitutus sp. GAS368]SDS48760.1 hypothetical protein SAMN05444173_3038 [Opitutus sp. GAS368]
MKTSPKRAVGGTGDSSAGRSRRLLLFASLWSLRQYPSKSREWSWTKKFAAIRDAGFDGVFSPPIPEMGERAGLLYLAVTSAGGRTRWAPTFAAARRLGAVGLCVQLCGYDTPLPAALKAAQKVRRAARRVHLPFAIETHRGTCTETPETTLALARTYRRATGENLPLCLDHSHFAVVRHLAPTELWTRLARPAALLRAATQFHLRPFNGHHCQLPALDAAGRRTPEYRDWLRYAAALLAHERDRPTSAGPLMVVAEVGHAVPAYRLSGFPDTWRDTVKVAADLRRLWRRGRVRE